MDVQARLMGVKYAASGGAGRLDMGNGYGIRCCCQGGEALSCIWDGFVMMIWLCSLDALSCN